MKNNNNKNINMTVHSNNHKNAVNKSNCSVDK